MFLGSRMRSRYPQVTATIVIFALSAGILGGLLFYMDSIGPTVFDTIIENSPNHMQIRLTSYYYSNPDIPMEDIHSTIRNQENVITTDDVMSLSGYSFNDEGEYYEYIYIGVENEFFSNYPEAVQFESGGHSLTNDSCFLEKSVANSMGLEIGDIFPVTVQMSNQTHWMIPVEANYTITGIFSTSLYLEYNYWSQEYVTGLRAIITQEAMNQTFGEYGYGGYDEINQEIWVKFDTSSLSLLNPFELEDNLLDTARQLEQDLIPYIQIRDFELLWSTYRFISWSSSMVILALAFSVPTLAMGFMLISYNSNMLADERRREVGMIKTRGASSWQTGYWILSNSLVTGSIGSLTSILLGTIAAFLSGSVKQLLIFDFTMLADFQLFLRWESIVVVFLFAFISGLIVSIPTAVKALLMTPTEAHQVIMGQDKFTHEKMGSPLKEMIILAIGLYFLTGLISIVISGFFIGSSLSGIAVLLVIVIAIVAISGGRLLSRPASQIKAFILSMINILSLASTKKMLSRTLLLYKKSEATGVLFISLVFTAGLFSAISANTGSVHLQNLFLFEVGSDISAEVKTGEYAPFSLADNISQIEGVESVTAILKSTAFVSYFESSGFGLDLVNRTYPIIGVDAESFLETMFLQDYFTADSSPAESITKIRQDNSLVIASFRPVQYYTGGGPTPRIPVYHNNITLHFDSPNGSVSQRCEIIDVMANYDQATKEYGLTYFPGKPDLESFIIVDLEFFHDILDSDQVTDFFVKTSNYANHTKILPEIYELDQTLFESIESSYLQTQEVLNSRMSQAVFGSYTLNVVFSLLYLSAGMIIVAVIKTRNYRKEFSILRALGTENSSILKTIVLDTMLSIAMALAIGTLLSLAFSFIVINLPLVFMGSRTQMDWTRLPISMFIPLDIVGGIITIAILSTLIAMILTMRYYLSRNITEEIQYAG